MKNTRKMSCPGKAKYDTFDAALEAKRSFYRDKFGGMESNSSVYKCSGHFHWGHTRDRKK